MDTIVLAFGPAFAAAFALQQFIEILKPLFKRLEQKRTFVIHPVRLAAGLGLSFGAGFRVLADLGYSGHWVWDALTTGLIISGGTEGFNSILKFLGYTKQKKKDEARKTAG